MNTTQPLYPLTLRLAGREALVVGGGPVAARRASGLIVADAVVTVVAPEVCSELADLIRSGAVTWLERGYRPGDLDGKWLVHTATGDPRVDEAVLADADAARVWCVDASDHEASTAWVPAVTRRHGVTISVAAGGDPRRATAVRDAVAAALDDGTVEPFAQLPPASARPRRVDFPAGSVALVGGGPGDPDLITVRGRDLLAQADVVVADRLGPRTLLAGLSDRITVIDAGKLPGHHPVPQDEINAILVRYAQAGKRVLRLKGGDPYVLGRGGEELAFCRDAGVPVQVVPGVTSAISAPAVAGIPVTHRGVAAGFTVVTGHDQLAELPGGRDHTVVLLMGVSGLARSAATLAAGTRGDDCPVAIVEDAYGTGERVTVGTLADIGSLAEATGVRSPAVVIVGDVVALGHHAHPQPASASTRPELTLTKGL
ncbi:uroporphyrinogen-III C-methyltransferase [Diaminobutyricibacter sp. McL0608]|uniref:uroporphyrinogen-III C-methyltransferase n=1 Tax=Leifsonia sp. McL0608 TaxID=3143537 RepID=UPI0031F30907